MVVRLFALLRLGLRRLRPETSVTLRRPVTWHCTRVDPKTAPHLEIRATLLARGKVLLKIALLGIGVLPLGVVLLLYSVGIIRLLLPWFLQTIRR